jgi:hypothetical protein
MGRYEDKDVTLLQLFKDRFRFPGVTHILPDSPEKNIIQGLSCSLCIGQEFHSRRFSFDLTDVKVRIERGAKEDGENGASTGLVIGKIDDIPLDCNMS